MFNQAQSTFFANIGGNFDLTPIIPKIHDRDEAIISAFESSGHSKNKIGEQFGLHCSRISRIVKNNGRKVRSKT